MIDTDYTLIVLPELSFEQDFLEATLKHVKFHFSRDEVYYLCVESMKNKCEHLSPLYTIEDNHLDLDNNEIAANAKQIVLMSNIDGKRVGAHWTKKIDIDIYENYLHGYGGLRKVLYRTEDKRAFKLDNKQNAFHSIASHSNDNLCFFPYLNFSHVNSKFGKDSNHEYGFRVPDNYQYLEKRDFSTEKVIVLTGGSACFGYSSFIGERFSDHLEKKYNSLNSKIKYRVLNFGFENHQILNEMITYLLFIMKIKPDVVISFSGLNDLNLGMISDSTLQKKYALTTQFDLEQMAARIVNYEQTLPCFSRNGFPMTSASIVVNSYFERVKQFNQIVQSSGATFVSVLQPIVYSKKKLSSREELLIRIQNNYLDNRSKKLKTSLLNPSLIMFIFSKFKQLTEKRNEFNFIDLNCDINNFGEEHILFNDRSHFSLQGETLIADILFENLKEFF